MDDTGSVGGRDLIARIDRALSSQGISFGIDGATATFEVDGRRLEREARWLPTAPSVSTFRRRREREVSAVYLADRITPALAREIRNTGSWYADADGNMYLRAPGTLLDVSGRTSTKERRHLSHGSTPHNLMSAGRAQVAFAILTWPHLLTQSLREIGQAAGVSTAAAHQALTLLEEEHFLTHSRRLVRRDELVDLWASAYPLGLARSTARGRYRGEPSPEAWPSSGQRVYVSGEYAAADLTGPDLVLYVTELDPQALLRSRWRRAETDDDANITLRATFWTEPGRWGEARPGIEAAPPLLVYGDLLASNDPRQREIAGSMRGSL